MAAQDFRHISQRENESTSSFIRRLERTFQLAYGRDGMLSETRDALLCSQLQEGLRDNLMEAPAVSGALNYQALCIAAKNEERRQTELKKRKQYHKPPTPPHSSGRDEDSRAKAPNLGARIGSAISARGWAIYHETALREERKAVASHQRSLNPLTQRQ